jgi:hypothetical protein
MKFINLQRRLAAEHSFSPADYNSLQQRSITNGPLIRRIQLEHPEKKDDHRGIPFGTINVYVRSC